MEMRYFRGDTGVIESTSGEHAVLPRQVYQPAVRGARQSLDQETLREQLTGDRMTHEPRRR